MPPSAAESPRQAHASTLNLEANLDRAGGREQQADIRRAARAGGAAPAHGRLAPGPDAIGRREQPECLIVDDSRVIRKIARKIALALGYVPIEAEDGEEALARCARRMPELVLTDWQMPVLSGIEFVSRLRAMAGGAAPIVIFCTSKNAARDIAAGIAAGADDYVTKPFDEAMLRQRLAAIEAERRACWTGPLQP